MCRGAEVPSLDQLGRCIYAALFIVRSRCSWFAGYTGRSCRAFVSFRVQIKSSLMCRRPSHGNRSSACLFKNATRERKQMEFVPSAGSKRQFATNIYALDALIETLAGAYKASEEIVKVLRIHLMLSRLMSQLVESQRRHLREHLMFNLALPLPHILMLRGCTPSH